MRERAMLTYLLRLGYSKLFFPFASRRDPEEVHEMMIHALGQSCWAAPFRALLRCCVGSRKEAPVRLWNLSFPNRVGLAAGFDKNAAALPLFAAMGFGHIEVGTVTPEPQPGNPRPRIFRFVHDGALINRMGFPSIGAEAVAQSLQRWRMGHARGSAPIIGVNIGKQKSTPVDDAAKDYIRCFQILSPYADYITLNVSSPNTPELRKLQEPERLYALFQSLQSLNHDRIPLLVKLAPDLSHAELEEVLEVCRNAHVDGIIATNTTLSREGLSVESEETGGLSGRPLFSRSLDMVQLIHARMGDSIPIIAVGGIRSVEEARAFLAAGASLVQIYTGLVFEGPTLVPTLVAGLRHA